MNFPFYIARRYLFSKKSHNTINIISAISVGGVALATMALVCTLSVFNGFMDLIGGLYTNFDPQIEISPATGKFADASDPLLQEVRKHQDVAVVSESLEENAMILFVGRPLIIRLKGVDDKFQQCSNIDSILYLGESRYGSYTLQAAEVCYGIPSVGLVQQFGCVEYGSLPICAPRKGERINVANPTESFNVEELFSPGIFFQVNQKTYDANYMITSLQFARELFEQPGKISALGLRLKEGADVEKVKKELQGMLGDRYQVKNQHEIHKETYSIMKIEKSIAFLFLSFIVLIACFNIVGSLSMLIIEKREDVETLRHLGATDKMIQSVFLLESRMITLLGAVVGIVLGLLFCYLQQTFGFIRFGSAAGNFIIDAYPVSVYWLDIVLVFVTVLVVGFITVWYPVKYLTKKML